MKGCCEHFIAIENSTGRPFLISAPDMGNCWCREEVALRFIAHNLLGHEDAFEDGFYLDNLGFTLYRLPEDWSQLRYECEPLLESESFVEAV